MEENRYEIMPKQYDTAGSAIPVRSGTGDDRPQKEDIALVCLQQAFFHYTVFSKAYRELGNCLDRLGCLEKASVYRLIAPRSDPMHSGATVDGIAMKRQVGDQPVHVLTCLVC